MAKLFGFNERRATVLNRVADREGLAPRTKGGVAGYGGTLPDAAGMFVAKVPDPGGIPGRTGLTPGSASCEIYKLGTGSSLEEAGFEQTVYNPYPDDYEFDEDDSFIEVYQDRFGLWFCERPDIGEGGGGTAYARFIGFTISENETGIMQDVGDQMQATLDYRIQGATPPLDGNGELTVHDDQEVCPLAVAGARGFAVRNDNLGSVGDPYYQILTCDQLANLGRAMIQQAMCGPDHPVVAVSNFQVMSTYPHSMSPEGRIIGERAFNPHKHRAPFGSQVPPFWVTVAWGRLPHIPFGLPFTQSGYYIIDVDKQSMGIPVNFRLTSDKKIQKQVGTFAVESCLTNSGQLEFPWEQMFPEKDC